MTDPVQRADQSVATRFTRVMKATTSRYGVLTDPPIIAVLTAVLVIALLAAMQVEASAEVVLALRILAALPLGTAVAVTLALSGARGRVVAWLSRQPFPVENMNAVLNGVGESLEVRFEGEPPPGEELNPELDAVHTDVFVTGVEPESRTVEIRIGVVDDKRNPSGSNQRRYARVQQIVERVLVPLAARRPIASVYVK